MPDKLPREYIRGWPLAYSDYAEGWNDCRAAMLQGWQPCHQITASMAKAIALKLGAELNNEEAEIFADGYNAAMLHAGN